MAKQDTQWETIRAELECAAGRVCGCRHQDDPDAALYGCPTCKCVCPWPDQDATPDDPETCPCCGSIHPVHV